MGATIANAGAGIFANSLKPPTTVFRLAKPVVQRRQTLVEDLLELLRRQRSGPPEVVDRETQREERILQLVREPPRQLPPCGDAFGLDQPFALLDQLSGHVVERLRQLADLSGAVHASHANAPVARGDLPRGIGNLLHGSRHPGGDDIAERRIQ